MELGIIAFLSALIHPSSINSCIILLEIYNYDGFGVSSCWDINIFEVTFKVSYHMIFTRYFFHLLDSVQLREASRPCNFHATLSVLSFCSHFVLFHLNSVLGTKNQKIFRIIQNIRRENIIWLIIPILLIYDRKKQLTLKPLFC